jgi:DUF2934 family protein
MMTEPSMKTTAKKTVTAGKGRAPLGKGTPVQKVSTERSVAPKPEAKKTAPSKPEQIKEPIKQRNKAITPEERYRMVAEGAYFRAQQRGFVGGDPLQDWLDAEAEVAVLLAEKT